MKRKGKIILTAVAAYAVLSILMVAVFYRKPVATPTADDVAVPTAASAETAIIPGTDIHVEAQNVARDISGLSFVEMQNLPALARMSAEDAKQFVDGLQVMGKVRALGLTDSDLLYPLQRMEALSGSFTPADERSWNSVEFTGATAAELNAFIAQNPGKKIVVTAAELKADEAIVLASNTWVAGSHTNVVGGGAFPVFSLDHVEGAAVSGFTVIGGFDYGVYAAAVKDVSVADCDIRSMNRKPIVFAGDCENIMVLRNHAEGNQQGGIYFNGDIARVLVEDNDFVNNFGTSNWMAGVVLTGEDIGEENDIYAIFADNLHFPVEQRLDTMLKAPHDVLLRNNRVMGNNSSGVYCDGPYRVYVVENRIEGNDKEGMCLDYGTIGAYVARNDIMGNGGRARQTDQDLKDDFVLEAGRLPDGSSRSKLPGVSIDNSAYNIVYNNRVEGNFGSGVKMVRTGVRNIISTNLITDNNRGAGETFHFFGIELGYAVADAEAENLDFTADFENIICRNMITGSHYAGAFLDRECYINDFFDNTILDATSWSMESLTDRFNSCVNNYSNVQSRGISLTNAILALPVAGSVG